MKTRISAPIIFPEKHDFPIEIWSGTPRPPVPLPDDPGPRKYKTGPEKHFFDFSDRNQHMHPVQHFALFRSRPFSAKSTVEIKTRISRSSIFSENHDFPIEIITGKSGPLDPHPGDFQNLKIRIRTFEFLETREHHPPTPNFALFPSKTLSAKVIRAISSDPRLPQSSS